MRSPLEGDSVSLRGSGVLPRSLGLGASHLPRPVSSARTVLGWLPFDLRFEAHMGSLPFVTFPRGPQSVFAQSAEVRGLSLRTTLTSGTIISEFPSSIFGIFHFDSKDLELQYDEF